MPHANIWIRKNDWDRWTHIDNKSDFISDALNSKALSGAKLTKEELKMNYAKLQKTPHKEPKAIDSMLLDRNTDLCPHGYSKVLRMCKAGCK